MLKIFAPFCFYKHSTEIFCMKNYTPHQFYATEKGRFFASRFESFRCIQHISLWVGRVTVGKKGRKRQGGGVVGWTLTLPQLPSLIFTSPLGLLQAFAFNLHSLSYVISSLPHTFSPEAGHSSSRGHRQSYWPFCFEKQCLFPVHFTKSQMPEKIWRKQIKAVNVILFVNTINWE